MMNQTSEVKTRQESTPKGGMMRARQRPLIRKYREEPETAWIVDQARTVDGALHRNDPVHGELLIGAEASAPTAFSIHHAIGGDHDGPNPGDFLCASLAGCIDATMRIIADRMGLVLENLRICVSAEVDARGTLCVSPDVPVAFQKMSVQLEVQAAEGTSPEKVQMLIAAAEHCCVIMQTLRKGVEIETSVSGLTPEAV